MAGLREIARVLIANAHREIASTGCCSYRAPCRYHEGFLDGMHYLAEILDRLDPETEEDR